jgi:plasmid stabilization system protein ParE
LKVRYTPQAGRDLREVFECIARDNAAAAAKTLDRVAGLA